MTIRYILSELEEREREDTFRLRRIKQKKVKSAMEDGAGEQINVKNVFGKEEDKVLKPQADKPADKKPEETKSEDTKSVEPKPDSEESPKVQPKEAAEMGDLIMIKPPDDKQEIGDVFIPAQSFQTMGTITEVNELIEDVPDFGDNEKLEKKLLDDKNIQKAVEKVSVKNYKDNLETGEWFETPSKLQNIADKNENLSDYSKLDKFEDNIREVSNTETKSAVKMSLESSESTIDLDKKALASLYKGIDSNFYQTTLDDIMSKHDIAMQNSISLQDNISIIDHSLVDLESIDFSIDSKGNVVPSKHGTGQSLPALSTNREADGPKLTRDVDGDLTTSTGGLTSVKRLGEGVMPTVVGGNKLKSEFENKNEEDKMVESATEDKTMDKDVNETTSELQMPLKATESIPDLDKRALSSLYKDIDFNFYEPTLEDIMSKHDIAMQNSTSLQDISIIDQSLVDIESIDFSINSKGNVVPSMHDTGQSLPALSMKKAADEIKTTRKVKDDPLTAPTGRTASVKWLSDNLNIMETQFQDSKSSFHDTESPSTSKKDTSKSSLSTENKNVDNAESNVNIEDDIEKYTANNNGLNEKVSKYSKQDKLKEVVGGSKPESTSAMQMPLKATESITDLDKRALSSLYKDIDSNYYEPTLDDIMSKHDIAMRESSDKSIDHSYADLESLDFSISSKGNVMLSLHDPSSPTLSINREFDGLKMTSRGNDDILASSTGALKNSNVAENRENNVLESAISVERKTIDALADTGNKETKIDATANDERKLDKSHESIKSKDSKADKNENINDQLSLREMEDNISNVEQTHKESAFDKIEIEHDLGNNPVELKNSRIKLSNVKISQQNEQNHVKLDTSKLSILVEVSKESQFDEERDGKDLVRSEKIMGSKTSFRDNGKSSHNDSTPKDNQNFDRIEKESDVLERIEKVINDSKIVEEIKSQEKLQNKKDNTDVSDSKIAGIKKTENGQLKPLSTRDSNEIIKTESETRDVINNENYAEGAVSQSKREDQGTNQKEPEHNTEIRPVKSSSQTDAKYIDTNTKRKDSADSETDETKDQGSKLLKNVDSKENMQENKDGKSKNEDEKLKRNNQSNAEHSENEKTKRDNHDQRDIEHRRTKETSIDENKSKSLKIQNSDENINMEERDKKISDDSESKGLKRDKESEKDIDDKENLKSDNERSSSDTNEPGKSRRSEDHIKQD